MDNFNDLEKQIMSRVLELASRGLGQTRTNPLVGCVIVKNNRIVGEGYHQYFGGPHAEIVALKNAGKSATGATLYVNLEPCNHFGKTPPCTGAIINARIKKVIVAMKDPNPLVNGRGIRTLRRAGIKVEVGLLKKNAQQINLPYLKYIRTGYPYVIAKIATSLDGKIATHSGNSRWISSTTARKYVHRLRSRMDAIIVGVNTIIKDNPELSAHSYQPNPTKVIIDPYLRVPPKSRIFRDKNNIILAGDTLSNLRRAESIANARFIFLPLNNHRLSFRRILKELADRSFNRILIEGGGTTIAEALKEKMIDEFIFFIAPKIIGGKDAPTAVEGGGVEKVSESTNLNFLEIKKVGVDIFIRAKPVYH